MDPIRKTPHFMEDRQAKVLLFFAHTWKLSAVLQVCPIREQPFCHPLRVVIYMVLAAYGHCLSPSLHFSPYQNSNRRGRETLYLLNFLQIDQLSIPLH